MIEIDPAETVIQGVIYYKIQTAFDGKNPKIKSGMTVNLEIETDKKSNVIMIPVRALRFDDSIKYVEVLYKGKPKRVEISTGIENDQYAEITSGLKEGDKIKCVIDWDRRYKLMRLHTAAHLIASIFHNKGGALITGGNIELEKSRIDFSLENFDRNTIDEYAKLANELIQKDAPVKISYMKREEALKIPDMVKLANKMPPEVETLRIVEIEGIDKQADGGCHVKSLREIGTIEILKLENKGKSNRRVYFDVKS